MHRKPISLLSITRMLAMTLPVWLTSAALADDVELFISTDDQSISCPNPNVLFIIDTSTSMDGDVVTQEPWDPNKTYAGCFGSSRIYYSESGTAPDCGFGFTFGKAELRCATAAGKTEYTGKFQAWNPNTRAWEKIPDGNEDYLIECAADEGIHGGGGSETYAVDGDDGPWSENADDKIAWGANASSVTLFDGNWLNWLQTQPTITRSRLDVVKEVVMNSLDNMTDVNVGFMEFNPAEGGPVIAAMTAVKGAREALKAVVNGLVPEGGTPLAETLYEAGQYLAGRKVDFGDDDSDNRSVPESRVGNTIKGKDYLSPLEGGGQNNYIVLLTDGEPMGDTKANKKIQELPGYAEAVGEACELDVDGACLDNMAQYLNKHDLRDDLDGRQSVITHTIGFSTDFELLETTAERGGGKYFVADDTATLTRVLANLAQDFSRQASLLTSPTLPLNAFGGSGDSSDVYLALFLPAATEHWPGNLKKYRVASGNNGLILVDANGSQVLNRQNQIISTAVSLWSAPLVDGGDVTLGGAASRLLSPGTRNLLTNSSGNSLSPLSTGNASISATMLGAPEAERNTVIQWARGVDVRDANGDGDFTDPRLSMGDPLHVQPVVADYNGGLSVVFVSTNDGYLHAVDTDTGNELWSFVPRRLLSRLYALSVNDTALNKQYGLDGQLVLVTNAQGQPETLIFGMRRGGKAMFAMDIRNANSPVLKWIIDGNQSDFLDLGQTWSVPTIATMNLGGQGRTVAIFGGGYDSGQDNRSPRQDTVGNAVYIVDVDTGDLLWSAGSTSARSNHDLELADMNYSIPAGIRALDTNEDGNADRLYVGDMGGQVWRFDPTEGTGQGGILASLGAAALENPTAKDTRRFYNTPDVVPVSGNNPSEPGYVAINLGSGYRAHPLDTSTDDAFYSIRDFRAGAALLTEAYNTEEFPILKVEDLIDITEDTQPELEPSDPGWQLRMVQSNGEKILGESLTLGNVVFFNSFSPGGGGQSCLPGGGLNRSYQVSIFDGSPLTNLDNSIDSDNLTESDRSVEASEGVPLTDPTLFGDEQKICSGLNCFDNEEEDAADPADDNQQGIQPDIPNQFPTYWFPREAP